mmetsp:Transcript_65324/g.156152  ORF Transcript_65324/g.156152 Transcript_65324/m.156152 type:complete len:614 (-) Transcript_65324:24-1865(-)
MTGGPAARDSEISLPNSIRRHSQRPASARSVYSARSAGRSELTGTLTPRTQLAAETPTPSGRSLGGATDATNLSTKTNPRRPRSGVARSTGFTKLIERTVDNLSAPAGAGAYEDVQRVLAHIRKQYDEVHFEAERKEGELSELRKQVKVLEMMEEAEHHTLQNRLAREDLEHKLQEVQQQLQDTACSAKVKRHILSRLKHERNIMKEKVTILHDHASRKQAEADKRREESRRAHASKVKKMLELAETEAEITDERIACNQAVDDLEDTLQQREKDIRRREDFERWRYEVAMEAASEAFQSIAGRYQKIFTIEKLVGNCLQKIIFEQAEQSQATEDGFQKIREVTGLTDVMDIVHKFLNRDVEHEQLQQTVRDTELKLATLREERASWNFQSSASEADLQVDCSVPSSLTIEAFEDQNRLAKAKQVLEDYEKRVRQGAYLLDAVCQWARRMHSFVTAFENIAPLENEADLQPFFLTLAKSIDTLLVKARTEVPSAKLSKLTSQAHAKEKVEQQKLLNDKDFIRANCRVPASVEGPAAIVAHRRHPSKGHVAEEDDAQGVSKERERIKQESMQKVHEHSPKVWKRRRHRETLTFSETHDVLEKPDDQAPKAGNAA